MKIKIIVLLGIFFLSCGTPQLRKKDAVTDFTFQNIMSRSFFITPVVNNTLEKDLNTADNLIEESLKSERKYFRWIGAKKTVAEINNASLSKELDECLKQYGDGKTLDRELIRKFEPVLKANYIVFSVLNEYKENSYDKSNWGIAYESSLDGSLTIYDLKTGIPVFNTQHTVYYKDESSDDDSSASLKGNDPGECIGGCIFDMLSGCITGFISANYIMLMSPSPESMAETFFEEIGENLPEK